MSHFTVAVIRRKDQNLTELLAPYQENNTGDCPEKYLEFQDCTEEIKGDYADRDGDYKDMLIDEFAQAYRGYTIKDGKFGYFKNPNARWDWYVVGGRWRNKLNLKSGEKADYAKLEDVDFSMDEEVYKKKIRFWELKVEKQQPQNEKEKEMIRFGFYNDEYYTNHYPNKEAFAKSKAEFSTYAVVTPDGEWHSKGEMGWFGFSDETGESVLNWSNNFYNSFVKNQDPEYEIIIIDCHI